MGLKENVIIGKRIPAGTGLKKYKDLFVTTLEAQEAYEARHVHVEEEDDFEA